VRTPELIRLLAADPAPPRRPPPVSALGVAALAGAVIALAVLIAWLGLRDLGAAMHTGPYWMKAAYTVALAVAGLGLSARLARPAGRPGAWTWLAALAVVVIVGLGLGQLMVTPPGQRMTVWLGHSWNACPWRILLLSVPVYLAAALVLRRLAPTRLAAAGAAAGLLAGGVGATVYGLACTETAAAFVAVWYTLGVAACAALGAAAGRWVLRW
jgi:hypothetical protein